jgi:hypothetical protein
MVLFTIHRHHIDFDFKLTSIIIIELPIHILYILNQVKQMSFSFDRKSNNNIVIIR